jgi:hypothetical protein
MSKSFGFISWVAFVILSFFLAMWVGNDVGGYLLQPDVNNGIWWGRALLVVSVIVAVVITTMGFTDKDLDFLVKFRPGPVFLAAIAAGFAFGDVLRPYTTGDWWSPWLFLWLVGFTPLATNTFSVWFDLD